MIYFGKEERKITENLLLMKNCSEKLFSVLKRAILMDEEKNVKIIFTRYIWTITVLKINLIPLVHHFIFMSTFMYILCVNFESTINKTKQLKNCMVKLKEKEEELYILRQVGYTVCGS